MKKQLKKLSLQKETVVNLQGVTGSGATTIYYNDTVYRPQPSDHCSEGCPIQA